MTEGFEEGGALDWQGTKYRTPLSDRSAFGWTGRHRFVERVLHSSFFIPRGTPHTFLVLSDTPSRHLVIMTPGGFEGFFAEMAAGQYAIPDDMPRIEESAARFNLSFVGPPLAPSDFG
jgi:hypothetical protein